MGDCLGKPTKRKLTMKEDKGGNEIMGSIAIPKGLETFVFSRSDKINPIYVIC